MDRDLSKLHGDQLTWALHAENRIALATVNTKLNMVLTLLGGSGILFATVLGWLLMRG
jgi:hypothetical protein